MGIFEAMEGDEIPYEDGEFIREPELESRGTIPARKGSELAQDWQRGEETASPEEAEKCRGYYAIPAKVTLSYSSHLGRRPLHWEERPPRGWRGS